MYFKEIELDNFRNYTKEKVDFNNKINIIIGKNGQGKTNLLEGLYMMSLGKSFRTLKDNELIKFGSEYAKIKTISSKDDNDLTIEIGLIKNKKSIKIDGVKKNKIAELLEKVYIVVFSPDDMRIVKDEPEKRRRFMNRELCQIKPVYYENLAKYKKVLTQRNFLLKENNIDKNMLDVWDNELSQYGSKIIAARREFIDKISVISSKIHNDITDGKESLKLFYESDIEIADSIDEQKKIFRETLLKSREHDIFRHSTRHGPHRDDIRIEIEEIDVRNFASQGQQRSAALSLKLAELNLIYSETGERPVLLLDDVLSELDNTRQHHLITSFEDIQIFITTTEINDNILSQLSDFSIYEVEMGKVNKIR